jgi:hypothetical protein
VRLVAAKQRRADREDAHDDGRPWTDGDLLSIAFAWEQATHLRKPPTLVEAGLLKVTTARGGR